MDKKNGAYKERSFFKLIFTFDKGERKKRKAIRNNCQHTLEKLRQEKFVCVQYPVWNFFSFEVVCTVVCGTKRHIQFLISLYFASNNTKSKKPEWSYLFIPSDHTGDDRMLCFEIFVTSFHVYQRKR